jgi:hypothetical protein
MPGLPSTGAGYVSVQGVDAGVEVLASKTKPKKFALQGSDGKRHSYRPGRPGRLRGLGVFHRKSVLCGAFVRARRALDSQKRRFPARAVVKGHEDLHLDERIMQFLNIVTRMLASDRPSRARDLRARHYPVIPLGPQVCVQLCTLARMLSDGASLATRRLGSSAGSTTPRRSSRSTRTGSSGSATRRT